MIRLAVVGIGWVGERHVRAIRELNRKVQVACLVDSDQEHLASKAAELEVPKTYTSLEAALKDASVDAVDICAPHALHRPMAVAAAAAGKHILCEKPMALRVEDATAMIDAAERAGVKLYVAENMPYGPMPRFLRGVVERGTHIGQLTFASVVAGFRAQGGYGYPGRRAWLSEPGQGGTGTWMLHGIHTMAGLRSVFGEVATVYMREHKARSFTRRDVEGTMSGVLTLESGVPVSVVQTCETKLPGIEMGGFGGYVLHGDEGIVRASPAGYEAYRPDSDPPLSGTQLFDPEPLSEYALEIEAFADYLSEDKPGPTTGYSERRTLAIVEAGYESAKTGLPVHLRDRFPAIWRAV